MHHSKKKIIPNGKNGLNNKIKNTFLSEIRLHCNTFGPRLLLNRDSVFYMSCSSDKKEERGRQRGQLWKILTQWMKETSQTIKKDRKRRAGREREREIELTKKTHPPIFRMALCEIQLHLRDTTWKG